MYAIVLELCGMMDQLKAKFQKASPSRDKVGACQILEIVKKNWCGLFSHDFYYHSSTVILALALIAVSY